MLVALIPTVVFFGLLGFATVPYVSLGPGPTFDTLGVVDGKEVVDIDGTQEHPTNGHLNMTTVAQQDGLTLLEAMYMWFSGRDQMIPRDLVYPPDKSREEVEKENDEEFKSSEDSAEYAALGYLKYPEAVTVETVTKEGPSDGKLNVGDAVESVNGTKVATTDDFTKILKTTKPGDTVEIAYRRKNGPAGTTTITLGSNPDRPHGYLGVGVVTAPWAPFTVQFNLANIGGPSAGLMFSLAVIDKLTTGELAGDRFIAGTGTIDVDGKVGPIGGITHKMLAARDAGATVFLVPADNCDEARTGAPGVDGLELVKVSDLGGAVDALKSLSAGSEPPRC